MSLLSEGLDDGDDLISLGAVTPAKRTPATTPTQQKSGSSSIGPDIPWTKILIWGTVSAGGLYVGHKIYKHYTAKPARQEIEQVQLEAIHPDGYFPGSPTEG